MTAYEIIKKMVHIMNTNGMCLNSRQVAYKRPKAPSPTEVLWIENPYNLYPRLILAASSAFDLSITVYPDADPLNTTIWQVHYLKDMHDAFDLFFNSLTK